MKKPNCTESVRHSEKPIEKPTKQQEQQEYCPNCGYKTVSDGKYVCCFACGYNV